MNNPYLYPGRGIPLYSAGDGVGNVAKSPLTTVITDGELSRGISADDCLELRLTVDAESETGVSVQIQRSSTKDFAVASTVETLVLNGAHSTYSPGVGASGFYRVLNDSTRDITVTAQKRIN